MIFDPLHPTYEEETEMIQGYRDGINLIDPICQTPAYLFGYKNGSNDILDRDKDKTIQEKYSMMMIQIRIDHNFH